MHQLTDYLIMAPAILIALTIHEYAHGYVAYRLGDPTAKMLGRLSLNPLVHLDLLGTAMLFIVGVGWAKPVPVNPQYFRQPKRDLLWVSLAGPASNLMLAFLFGLGLRVMAGGMFPPKMGILMTMIWYGMTINIVLAVFNLLPIPPLDGSKILFGLIPSRYESQLSPLMKFGPTILIAIIVFGFLTKRSILWMFIEPFVRFFSWLFAGMS